MDRAVSKVTEMTDDNETLTLVTADHSHVMSIAGYPIRGNPILGQYSKNVKYPKIVLNPHSLHGN